MYLRVVWRSLDSVIVYDTFIYMIFDILFVLSYFIYFDRMELSPKIKFTYLLTYYQAVDVNWENFFHHCLRPMMTLCRADIACLS